MVSDVPSFYDVCERLLYKILTSIVNTVVPCALGTAIVMWLIRVFMLVIVIVVIVMIMIVAGAVIVKVV